MLGIIPLRKVLQDAATLKHVDGLPVRERVRDGGDPAVWVDLQEPGFLLGILTEFDLVDFVGEAITGRQLATARRGSRGGIHTLIPQALVIS